MTSNEKINEQIRHVSEQRLKSVFAQSIVPFLIGGTITATVVYLLNEERRGIIAHKIALKKGEAFEMLQDRVPKEYLTGNKKEENHREELEREMEKMISEGGTLPLQREERRDDTIDILRNEGL